MAAPDVRHTLEVDAQDRAMQVAAAKKRAEELVGAEYPTTADVSRECDLVMKGGITSGVVYPLAACELATTYRYCNLGGSSAGAIAAAMVAAAEYGRDSGGFNRLAGLPDQIGPDLPKLFKPGPHTKTAHQALMQWLDKSVARRRKVTAVGRVLIGSQRRSFWLAIGTGLLVAVLVALLGAGLPTTLVPALRFAFLLALVGVLTVGAATGWALYQELRASWNGLARQGFGICVGSAPGAAADNDDEREAAVGDPGYLTDWLAAKIDEVAGVDRPLTFGDLEAHGITLRVMTTDLSTGRPLTFPFTTTVFLFEPDELSAYFPPSVMRQLLDGNEPADRGDDPLVTSDGKPLYWLPPPAELPVVMAARMSLSFPGLISAVPLWAIDYSRRSTRAQRPVRCWFSDGGITSNFPVHLFDALWPRRPTFALDLRSYHVDYPDDDVYYSGRNARAARMKDIRSPGGFVAAILDTMQYWADNGHADLPGFRDRIVEVHLNADEGGMNLTMDEGTIAVLAEKGRQAAEAIKPHTGRDATVEGFDFVKHRVGRFATSIDHLQQAASALEPLWRQPLADGSPGYRELIDTHRATARGGRGWVAADAQGRADELIGFGDDRPPSFADYSARPRGKLRITPDT